MKLGLNVIKKDNAIVIQRVTKETKITLSFDNFSNKCKVVINGEGDLSHHLVEDLMLVINKLAEIKKIPHNLS